MKYRVCCLLLILLLCLSLTALATHPPSFGANPKDYAGTWVVDGYEYTPGEGYTNLPEGAGPAELTLNADGSCYITYPTEEGTEVTTGTWEVSQDTSGENNIEDFILVDLDPKGPSPNDLVLLNAAGALRDSESGTPYVRPGLQAGEYDGSVEGFEEKFAGSWICDGMHIVSFDPPFANFVSGQDLMAGSGESEMILNFNGGKINFVSLQLEVSIPGLPVTYKGATIQCFNPETGLTHTFYFVGRNKMYMESSPIPPNFDFRMDFTRVQ
jgi:hypothetical protein